MTASISIDGNCPCCKSKNWKTLEALALTQRTRVQLTVTGSRSHHQRDTTGFSTAEVAAQHAPPVRPADYDMLERYRTGCTAAIKAAERRLTEIDGARQIPGKLLPGLFKLGPESYASTFEHYARKLTPLLRYEEDLARWKAIRICLRCVTTFIDAGTISLTTQAMVFRFAGQERRCPDCQSYFWKRPASIAAQRERAAEDKLAQAREQLTKVKVAHGIAATTAPPTGLIKRLAAFLTPAPVSLEIANSALERAELNCHLALLSVGELRARFEGRSGMRWCAGCEAVYSGPSATL